MSEKRVVITGLGVVAPNGVGLVDFESGIRAGRSGIQYLDRLAELGFGCCVGGVPPVTEEQKNRYFDSLTLRHLQADGVLYGCLAGMEAWENAGLTIDREGSSPDWDSGCVFGAGLAGADVIREATYKIDAKNVKRLGSSTVQQTMSGGVSAYLGGLIGLGNQVTTNASACSTGTEAILLGYQRIRAGFATRMLCGGCDSASPYVWAGFDAMRALNRKSNDRPEAASRPLSASAGGFVPGGGAGALVLEDLEAALARRAPILAEVRGGYINSGGQRNGGTMTAPNREGIERCIRGALANSGVLARAIDAVSGHLTATMFDAHEVSIWAGSLGRRGKDFPFINALKSMTGHCLSASGAIEAAASVLQLSKGFIHPSVNCEDLHPDIAEQIFPGCVPQQVMNYDLNLLISASFGFGDVNSCIVLQKFLL